VSKGKDSKREDSESERRARSRAKRARETREMEESERDRGASKREERVREDQETGERVVVPVPRCSAIDFVAVLPLPPRISCALLRSSNAIGEENGKNQPTNQPGEVPSLDSPSESLTLSSEIPLHFRDRI